MTTLGRTSERRAAFLLAAASVAVFLWGGANLRAQGDIDDIDDLQVVDEVAAGEERGPSWRRWEAGLQAGQIVLTGNAYSQNALTYGLQLTYRFGGKGKAKDGVIHEMQGRHGIEASAISYETDYFASHSIFTGADVLPLFLKFGGTSLSFPSGWFAMEAAGQYSYTVVSVNYVYSQLDKRFRLRKLTPYYLAGLGYAFGSADISISTRVRRTDCDPSDPSCSSWNYLYGTMSESGGSGICDPNDANYNVTLCSQAEIARSFFSYEFYSAPVAHLGAGLRWQWKPKWVVNFEIRDYLVLYDDSHFPAPGGTDLNIYEFRNADAYGHSFLIKIGFVRNFNLGGK